VAARTLSADRQRARHRIDARAARRSGGTVSGSRPRFDFSTAHRALKDLFAAAGHAEALADEALEVFFAARNRVEFYDDVRPSLIRLRARYRLFALSNGNADLQRCGIADLFAGHVTARAAGAAKPDARIFARLAALAGVEAHQVLHIGDDPEADVARRDASRNASGVAQPRWAGVAQGISRATAHPFRRSRKLFSANEMQRTLSSRRRRLLIEKYL